MRAYVAIARLGDKVLAYVCDGDGLRKASISEWFLGPWNGGSLDLRSRNGVALDAQIGQRGAYVGRLILADRRHLTLRAGAPRRKAAFLSIPHTDPTHTESRFDGFIQLPDGTDRAKNYGPAITDGTSNTIVAAPRQS